MYISDPSVNDQVSWCSHHATIFFKNDNFWNIQETFWSLKKCSRAHDQVFASIFFQTLLTCVLIFKGGGDVSFLWFFSSLWFFLRVHYFLAERIFVSFWIFSLQFFLGFAFLRFCYALENRECEEVLKSFSFGFACSFIINWEIKLLQK